LRFFVPGFGAVFLVPNTIRRDFPLTRTSPLLLPPLGRLSRTSTPPARRGVSKNVALSELLTTPYSSKPTCHISAALAITFLKLSLSTGPFLPTVFLPVVHWPEWQKNREAGTVPNLSYGVR